MESTQGTQVFAPSTWAKQVRTKPTDYMNIGWLLDHWFWPFTESELATWLISNNK